MVTDRCSTLGLLYVLGGDYSSVDANLGFPVFRCVSSLRFCPILDPTMELLESDSHL